ncbi:MAG TPA: cytochrome c oxidase subunit II [Solirubrobacterales bacterium]|nr:cytochrome c oxidase subunit II [Solirubrobacterales bacterium]
MLGFLSPPSGHSPNADDLNTLYWVMLVIGVLLLVAINGALIALAMRFRSARGREPRRLKIRRPAQFGAAGAFAVLAFVVFVLGVIVTHDAKQIEATGSNGLHGSSVLTAQRSLTLPAVSAQSAPLEIMACGQQWIWRYEYPDGTYSYYELVVPVDTAVILDLCSTDVVHRWWVPGLSGKFDATPGASNSTWFKADEEGVYDGASYAFSGASYAAMRTRVRVVDVPTYQSWLEQQAAGIQSAQDFVQQVNGETG